MNAAPVIIDMVKSSALPDRAQAQAHVRETFATISSVVPPQTDLWATVGDEFQAVYPDALSALKATALVQLLSDIDCRFGIGYGRTRRIEQAPAGPIEDGPGWSRAREAIDQAADFQSRGRPWLRTWIVGGEDLPSAPAVQAYLITRDHIINRMKAKERRIAAAWLMGTPQIEIARAEKMSQAGVSSSLNTSGGRAVVYALEHLKESPW